MTEKLTDVLRERVKAYGYITSRPPRERRLAFVWVSADVLADFILPRGELHVRVESPVPPDSVLYAVYWDVERYLFKVIFWSQQFEIVPEGVQIPEMRPVVFHILGGAWGRCDSCVRFSLSAQQLPIQERPVVVSRQDRVIRADADMGEQDWRFQLTLSPEYKQQLDSEARRLYHNSFEGVLRRLVDDLLKYLGEV